MRAVQLAIILATALTSSACQKDYEIVDLAGRDGILRFNLVFDNELDVDLDLHVLTPMGDEIFWSQKEGISGGQLDIDCFCGEENCLEGPNENIYWDYGGEAPEGTYEIVVNYFGSCDLNVVQESNYTLRVLEAGVVTATYTGTLGGAFESDGYTHIQ